MKKKLLTLIGAIAMTIALSFSSVNDTPDSSTAAGDGPDFYNDPGYGDIG